MKKNWLLVLTAILLVAVISYAQSPRQPTTAEGKTTYTNLAVTGLDVTGVPSYIEFQATDSLGTMSKWYLYVNGMNGNLMIASSVTVGTTTAEGAPKVTTWFNGAVIIGTVVGGQT